MDTFISKRPVTLRKFAAALRSGPTSMAATHGPIIGLLILAVLLVAPVPADAGGVLVDSPMLKRFLKGPMKDIDEIVFAARVPGRDHWYVTFGNYADHSKHPRERAFKKADGVYWGYAEGGRLCVLNLRTGKLRTLLNDPKGGIRDPQVHYSGEKILFSYRTGGEHPFHLYEINSDGTNLTQLTDGPDDDIEPTYCPDGSIVFCSSRCRRFVNCWFTRVAALYRCDGDGGNIRMLSSNNDHDNTPWMLPDGRVLYMRWEYVDRSQVHYHHLWTMNPDGTNQMVYYGNMHGGVAMLDAKPIPDTDKIVASFSPGHGRSEHRGAVTVVTPKLGPDRKASASKIVNQNHWKDPYAITRDCFLVCSRKGIFVMDGAGKSQLIYHLPRAAQRLECSEPRPLRARPRENVIPPRVDLKKRTGQLILADVYRGRHMASVKRGTIKKLLVLQQLPKPVNFSGGMQPLTIGGSFTLAEILGTVPVHADGSAYMEVPALKSIFFVALDENDLAVKRMHSFVTVQPGETTSCVGCHEKRTRGPDAVFDNLIATRKGVTPVEDIPGVPDVIDYPRDVQPILDRHCTECHSPDRLDGGVDLSGDKTAMYTMSYWTMQTRGLVSDGRNRPRGNYPPYAIGSSASRLMKLIDGSHYKAKLSPAEKKIVRLWIETSATYPGTYASLASGTHWVHLPKPDIGRMVKRCGSCHMKDKSLRFGRSVHNRGPAYNISRPDKSLILRAPLAKKAGGHAMCKKVVFAGKDDPLYKSLLGKLRHAHQRLMEGKRFDMPGFRPNKHYIREMQRFGILPEDLKPTDPIDVYKVDRAYWDSFDYHPKSSAHASGKASASTERP